ncbi:MAG: hypothetical protein COB02_14185 [Candidatus Cloacimonadota bacterium]|nr:MAG: hypothetical protein COB02_14185 [Candidatus Cloacimonadota bacterium]
MKICKKCKTGNETNSRFCYQCGLKLQSGFPRLAIPKSKGLKRSSANFNPSHFIAHPMQDQNNIISAKNQGDMITSQLPKKEVKKSFIQKELQAKLSKAPSSLKNKTIPLNLPELKIPKSQIKSKEKLRANKSHASILNPNQKLLLQKHLPNFKGVKPSQTTFDMIKVEKMKAQELEKQIKIKRQKQIEKDLAYLDQLFPNDKKITTSNVDTANSIQQKASILEISIPEPTEEAVIKIKKIDRIPIKKKAQEQNTVLNTSKSNQWVNSLKNTKQKSPSEELKNYHTGDSSELITPLLTFASFIYFFYVLYI